MVRLVIAEPDSSIASVWREAFEGVPSVEIKDLSPPDLTRVEGLDMEVLPAFLAHERYGGRCETGVAQVLSTRGEDHMPPWVVATPVVSTLLNPGRAFGS